MGAWLQKFQGKGHPDLPGTVVISGDSKHPGGGFFEAPFQPLVLNNPSTGLQHSKRLANLGESDFDYRLDLSAKLNAGFEETYKHSAVRAYSDVYKNAVKVMKSADLAAFDLSQESSEAQAEYRTSNFGQGCLLARRLVEHGVRFVEVSLGGWDMHQDIYARLQRIGELDKALGALLGDLDRRGLLNETLVVLASKEARPHAKDQPKLWPRPLPESLPFPCSGAAASKAVRSTARPTRHRSHREQSQRPRP